jgi:hypothetical protein
LAVGRDVGIAVNHQVIMTISSATENANRFSGLISLHIS